MEGKLYLIPSFLGTENANEVFPELNISIIRSLRHFIVEDERTARRFIKRVVPEMVIDELSFKLLNEHTRDAEIGAYLEPCKEVSIGLLSDAGVPCIADPGSLIVKMAHAKGIDVIPLVGPSSIILALMASGMNGQNFAFQGYLPIAKPDRSKAIKTIEKRSQTENQTQLFIETPYRNVQLLEELVRTCSPQTQLCVACDLTLPEQYIKTYSIEQWRTKKPDIHKRPALFILKLS